MDSINKYWVGREVEAAGGESWVKQAEVEAGCAEMKSTMIKCYSRFSNAFCSVGESDTAGCRERGGGGEKEEEEEEEEKNQEEDEGEEEDEEEPRVSTRKPTPSARTL